MKIAVILAFLTLGGIPSATARSPAGGIEADTPLLLAASRGALPTRVGTCVRTSLSGIFDRFGESIRKPAEDGFDSGTSVKLANGGYQVSYEKVAAVTRSRVGDPVLMCLVSLPKNCPKGDDRGKMYTTTNLRTQESWTLPDAQHMCGGA